MLEQHPVPQNVTTFQFRLIGDMTLKQFGYLAGGAILAYISYNLPLPFFFRYPLAAIFGLGGIGFAFVPIEERPMDVWFISFIRSVYSPTQYLWQREPTPPAAVAALEPATAPQKKTATAPLASLFNFAFLKKPPALTQSAPVAHPVPAASTTSAPIKPVAPQKSTPKASWFNSIFSPASPKKKPDVDPSSSSQVWKTQPQPSLAYAPAMASQYPAIMASAPIPTIAGKHLEVTPQAPQTQQSQTTEKPAAPPPVSPPSLPSNPQNDTRVNVMEQKLKELEEQLQKEKNAKQNINTLQEQLVNALKDKQQLEKQLEEVQKFISQQQKPQEVLRNAGATTMKQQTQTTVNVFTPDAAKSAGIPTITTIPNVVSGIVRERTGNLLVGILVTVKDKEDVPVRALKTNKLGQFAASTPLANGTYTLEVEDPKGQFYFDQARVMLNGTVIPPIEIIAKTQQELDRKQLEHAVFGQQKV